MSFLFKLLDLGTERKQKTKSRFIYFDTILNKIHQRLRKKKWKNCLFNADADAKTIKHI